MTDENYTEKQLGEPTKDAEDWRTAEVEPSGEPAVDPTVDGEVNNDVPPKTVAPGAVAVQAEEDGEPRKATGDEVVDGWAGPT